MTDFLLTVSLFNLLSINTDRPGKLCYNYLISELCYNFPISKDFTQLLNFATTIPDCDSPVLLLQISFFLFNPSICSTVTFPPLENRNPDHAVVSVSMDYT